MPWPLHYIERATRSGPGRDAKQDGVGEAVHGACRLGDGGAPWLQPPSRPVSKWQRSFGGHDGGLASPNRCAPADKLTPATTVRREEAAWARRWGETGPWQSGSWVRGEDESRLARGRLVPEGTRCGAERGRGGAESGGRHGGRGRERWPDWSSAFRHFGCARTWVARFADRCCKLGEGPGEQMLNRRRLKSGA